MKKVRFWREKVQGPIEGNGMLRILTLAFFLFQTTFVLAFSQIEFHSLRTEYTAFMEQSIGKALHEQIELWEILVESKLPEIYRKVIYRDSKIEKLYKSIPMFTKLNDRIISQFEIFENRVPEIANSFAVNNPEISFETVKIIALPSLMDFNGKVSIIDKGTQSLRHYG